MCKRLHTLAFLFLQGLLRPCQGTGCLTSGGGHVYFTVQLLRIL